MYLWKGIYIQLNLKKKKKKKGWNLESLLDWHQTNQLKKNSIYIYIKYFILTISQNCVTNIHIRYCISIETLLKYSNVKPVGNAITRNQLDGTRVHTTSWSLNGKNWALAGWEG